MTKLLKVRVLLPALILTYVLLGVFVVPGVGDAAGHVILLLLDAALVVLLGYWFYRYDTLYKEDASEHRIVFRTSLLVAVIVLLMMVYHLFAIVSGFTAPWSLYYAEVGLPFLAGFAWLIYENNKK